jgi:hypothetical protein
MTKEQELNFYLKNLGPEISRYLRFLDKFPAQAKSAKERTDDIFVKIFQVSNDIFLKKELESLYDFVFKFKLLNTEDINKFFLPIITKNL